MRADVATLLRTAAIVFVLGSPVVVMRMFGDGGPVTNLFTPLSSFSSSDAEESMAAQITTGDAQAYDQLWIGLDALHERSAEFTPEEFVRRSVELTAEFLELEQADEQQLTTVADEALASLDAARAKLEAAPAADRQLAWTGWREAQAGISADLASGISTATPRHVLLAEEAQRWLLRLDYGRRTATGGVAPD